MYGSVPCGLVFRMRDSLRNFMHDSIANSICAFWLMQRMWCCVYMRGTFGNYAQNRWEFNHRKFGNHVQSRWWFNCNIICMHLGLNRFMVRGLHKSRKETLHMSNLCPDSAQWPPKTRSYLLISILWQTNCKLMRFSSCKIAYNYSWSERVCNYKVECNSLCFLGTQSSKLYIY